MREILRSDKLPKNLFRYSPCIKTGPFYSCAGMLGLDPRTQELVPGGSFAESVQILQNLVAAMGDWGLGLEHLVQARIYSSCFADFPLINKAWEQLFTGEIAPPVRTSIGVQALPKDAKVEMEFSFYKVD